VFMDGEFGMAKGMTKCFNHKSRKTGLERVVGCFVPPTEIGFRPMSLTVHVCSLCRATSNMFLMESCCVPISL
jgi:hypothetical protein